jgi:macrophage erythroblast attacher
VTLQILVDLDLFGDIRRIELALERHSCTEALAWCSENKAALRKAKVGLQIPEVSLVIDQMVT